MHDKKMPQNQTIKRSKQRRLRVPMIYAFDETTRRGKQQNN